MKGDARDSSLHRTGDTGGDITGFCVDCLAEGMIEGYITRDNPSDSNGLDTVEQYLWFRLGNLKESHSRSIVSEVDIAFVDKAYGVLDKPKKGKEVDETSIGNFDTILKYLDQKSKVNLAMAVLKGQITQDNPSPSNGLTSLEQIIFLEYGCRTKEDMELIKREILAEIYALQGGYLK